MRSKGNPYSTLRCLPRMSWAPVNLYNLWLRSSRSPKNSEISFLSTKLTLFQQRFRSKKLVRAYHGDYIKEKQFKKWYLPDILPDIRPRTEWSEDDSHESSVSDEHFAQRKRLIKRDESRRGTHGMAPVASLMLREVERRIDVLIFRACFTTNIWEARRLVVHGHVLLNGKVHRNSNTRVAPADMITVDPQAIRFLTEPRTKEEKALRERHESWQKTWETKQDHSREVVGGPSEPPYQWDHVLERIPESRRAAEYQRLTNAAIITQKIIPPADTRDRTEIHSLMKGDVPRITPFRLPLYSSPWIFIPPYLEVSFNTCSIIYVRHPSARPGFSEIPTPYDADGEILRMAWDWYSYRRPRIATQKKKSRMPHDRLYDTPAPNMPHDKDFRGLRKSRAQKRFAQMNRLILQKVSRARHARNRLIRSRSSAPKSDVPRTVQGDKTATETRVGSIQP